MADLTIQFRDGHSQTFDVEGWSVGDPDGWVCVVFDGNALYFPRDLIERVTTPVIRKEVSDADVG